MNQVKIFYCSLNDTAVNFLKKEINDFLEELGPCGSMINSSCTSDQLVVVVSYWVRVDEKS